MVVGLGSGSTASIFIRELGKSGLRVTGIPTSEESRRIALELGLPLTTFNEHPDIDVTVDGADEVSPQLDLSKAWWRARARKNCRARLEARRHHRGRKQAC
jgi:ribose 5-phosphate isomerase A